MHKIHWIQAGPLGKRTGGFIYNRRIITGLREQGVTVELHTLPESFPAPSEADRREAAGLLARLPDRALTVIDGLVYGVLAAELAPHAGRLRLVALCHHPLALETGMSEQRARELHASESAALRHMAAILTTSHSTVANLQAYAVPADVPVSAILPGVDIAPVAAGSGGSRVDMLCVASLTARKGHKVLVDALAGLKDRQWSLICAGGAQHEPETARSVDLQIEEQGLDDRIALVGELDEAALGALYDRSDLFVLPSYHEGYGMVLVEALARGLPIVSTNAGAIPEVVPDAAGILVPPGDVQTLREALERLIDQPEERARLARGAAEARDGLRPWSAAVEEFSRALAEL